MNMPCVSHYYGVMDFTFNIGFVVASCNVRVKLFCSSSLCTLFLSAVYSGGGGAYYDVNNVCIKCQKFYFECVYKSCSCVSLFLHSVYDAFLLH